MIPNLRPEIQQFYNKIVGDDVFIIGGGPSLQGFDFSRLKNKNTICLNSSYKSLENPTAIYWMDQDWISKHYHIVSKLNCFKFTSRINCQGYIQKNTKIFGGSVLNKEKDYGFSTNINNVCGNNSGAQALNFVTNLKPHRIFLLGYDMKFQNGKSHFHEGYELSNASVYKNLFVPSINVMAPFIEKMGIEVINCNKNSELKCFRMDDLNNYVP